MPKVWSKWRNDAYRAANPDVTGNEQQHWLNAANAGQGRKLKPDNWAIPHSELPSELQILPQFYYDKLMREREVWKDIFVLTGSFLTDVELNLPLLYKRLTEDRTPLTTEEDLMLKNIVPKIQQQFERQKIWINHFNDIQLQDWGPGRQYFTTSSARFPEYKEYYMFASDRHKSRHAAWNTFRGDRASWAQRDYDWHNTWIPAVVKAFAERPGLEAKFNAEDKAAADRERARQEELRKKAQEAAKKAQEAAAKASYEQSLKFKTEEFNRALAAQRAESETQRKKLLDDFNAQIVNIRTDMARAHQEELTRRNEEYGRKSQEYETRLAQFSANFEKQAKELSGIRLELAKQKTDYENQIAARKLEESKRKQEAEVLQSNLKRRVAIYEADRGANLHFVRLNGGDGQIKGAKIFANSGGRYVKSRASYNPSGTMGFNSSPEDLDLPDLFLEALSPSNTTARNKRGRK